MTLSGFRSLIHRERIYPIYCIHVNLLAPIGQSLCKQRLPSHPPSLCPCVISSQHSRAAMLLRYPLHSGLGAFNAGIIPFPLALSFSGRVFAVYAIAPPIHPKVRLMIRIRLFRGLGLKRGTNWDKLANPLPIFPSGAEVYLYFPFSACALSLSDANKYILKARSGK